MNRVHDFLMGGLFGAAICLAFGCTGCDDGGGGGNGASDVGDTTTTDEVSGDDQGDGPPTAVQDALNALAPACAAVCNKGNECEGTAEDCTAQCSTDQLGQQLGVDGDAPAEMMVQCLNALTTAYNCVGGLSCEDFAASGPGDPCDAENSAATTACEL